MKGRILLVLLTLKSISFLGQTVSNDSILISQTVQDFYEWYIYSNRHEKNEENRPIFVFDSSSNVRLDLSKYLMNLKNHNFSDSLIFKEKLEYKNCENNLKTITKTEFLNYDGIDSYERLGCNFDNSYRWIGGQELCDGISIKKQTFLQKNICEVEIEYYSINQDVKSYWGNKTTVKLRRIKDSWEITEIKI
jgi:hypothetical protein